MIVYIYRGAVEVTLLDTTEFLSGIVWNKRHAMSQCQCLLLICPVQFLDDAIKLVHGQPLPEDVSIRKSMF
jgi:hypothetical protein